MSLQEPEQKFWIQRPWGLPFNKLLTIWGRTELGVGEGDFDGSVGLGMAPVIFLSAVCPSGESLMASQISTTTLLWQLWIAGTVLTLG